MDGCSPHPLPRGLIEGAHLVIGVGKDDPRGVRRLRAIPIPTIDQFGACAVARPVYKGDVRVADAKLVTIAPESLPPTVSMAPFHFAESIALVATAGSSASAATR